MQELGIERKATLLLIDGLPQSLQFGFGHVKECKNSAIKENHTTDHRRCLEFVRWIRPYQWYKKSAINTTTLNDHRRPLVSLLWTLSYQGCEVGTERKTTQLLIDDIWEPLSHIKEWPLCWSSTASGIVYMDSVMCIRRRKEYHTNDHGLWNLLNEFSHIHNATKTTSKGKPHSAWRIWTCSGCKGSACGYR